MVLLSGSFALLLSAVIAGALPATNVEPRPNACPAISGNPTGTSISTLPDPFTFTNGSPVATLDDWACRQAEISQLMQTYELGTKPGPPSSFTASFSGTTLSMTASNGGTSISFTASVTLPSGNGPFPAIIALDGGSIPRPSNVALINFNTNDIALQTDGSSRGKGKFYTLYGANHSAGAMAAWAWGISRIVDAIEQTPGAKIDPKKLAVTGCSRDGKGALVAGALEPRIVLTIPQESGSGGTASWRLSDDMMKRGISTQTASEIVGENVWFGTAFNTFARSSVNTLPFDHHSLMGLVAPRGLFVIDNVGIDWLGAPSSFGAMKAAHRIWDSLGASDSFGFSQAANHAHCAFPSSQQNQLNAFINKFLLGQSTNTNIQETAGGYTYTQGQWDPWKNPTLTGTSSGGSGSPPENPPTTTTATSAPPPPTTTTQPTSPAAPMWGQCGGIGWTGPTTCVSGAHCQSTNAYYSQCLPN
ncbi:carbohydrate-binding module 1 [Marasmius crinis-equi]|uniref:(4-O-methyl)-D-glucuronate--lignin esterase n=1 Tax=Marasmius crinis-equi TaxID=585013 RepID=A0ABR3FXC1_9AGAR